MIPHQTQLESRHHNVPVPFFLAVTSIHFSRQGVGFAVGSFGRQRHRRVSSIYSITIIEAVQHAVWCRERDRDCGILMSASTAVPEVSHAYQPMPFGEPLLTLLLLYIYAVNSRHISVAKLSAQ